MRKETFVQGEYYHIYNRGVDKRLIFLDDRDRFRFVNTLYILNNFQDIPANFDVVKLQPRKLLVPRDAMVEFAAGCLMSNHYHMIVRPLYDSAISAFLHKIGISYTMYFNKRNQRSGSLFEGSFKAKHIHNDEYVRYLTKYIHFNAYPLFQTKSGIVLMNALASYPWSTFNDYLGGKSNFSQVASDGFRDNILGMTSEEYKRYCLEALESINQT